MKKKPGYPALMALTIVLTLAGIASLLLSFVTQMTTILPSSPARLGFVIVPFFLAALSCITRKRFFTIQE
jgi:hypothetical protein